MRWLKYAGHPVLLVSIFILLLIEGDHFGGFFLMYILMALPHGGLFAVLAITGIITVLLGHTSAKPQILKTGLLLTGFMLMITSLTIFFSNSDKTGADATFNETIPTLTFVLFSVCGIFFLYNILNPVLKKPAQHSP